MKTYFGILIIFECHTGIENAKAPKDM